MTFQQMMAAKEDDLRKEIEKTERELLQVRMGIRLQQEKNTAKKTKKRKYIAQLKTALNNKQSSPEKTPLTS